MTGDPLTGSIALSRYEVEGLAAHGGMASVYRARDPILNRVVALKVLHIHLASDPACVERFRREAISAAALTHPGIISIFDTGNIGNRPCLVMEFMPGGSLADRIAQRPLSPEEAVAMGVTVARALHEAHRNGLVHRDVKPGNILFTESGAAKLGDFGIAKAGFDGLSGLTQTGQVIGTGRYLSTEQLRGHPATPSSDQFALGVVLYEALAGRPPFGGAGDPTGGLVRTGQVPALRTLARVPPALEVVITRALDDDPARRFPDCEAMARALSPALKEGGALGLPGPLASTATGFPAGPPAVPPTSPVLRPSPAAGGPVLPRPRRSGALAFALFAVVALAAAGALAVYLATDTVEGGVAPGGLAAGELLVPTRAVDFDPPPGSQQEHPEEVQLTIDGNPATVWTSEGYSDQFPAIKPGVGVYLDLGSTRTVRSVSVVTPATGWEGEVRVSESAADPSRLDDFVLIGPISEASSQIRLDAPARRVLVWVTRLPTSERRAGELQMSIGEIEVRGP